MNFHFNIMKGTKMLVYNFKGTRQYIISFLFVQNKGNRQVFIRIAIKSEAGSSIWAILLIGGLILRRCLIFFPFGTNVIVWS